MKQLRAVVFKSFLFVFATAFLWIGVFYMALDHAPDIRFATDGVYKTNGSDAEAYSWANVESLSEDGTQARVVIRGELVREWDIRAGTLLDRQQRNLPTSFFGWEPPPDGILARTANGNLSLRVIDTETKQGKSPHLVLWDCFSNVVRADLYVNPYGLHFNCRFSSDGRFVFAQADSSLTWWETLTGAMCRAMDANEFTLDEQAGLVITHCVTRDETTYGIPVAVDDHTFQLWDMATGVKVGECKWGSNAPKLVPAHWMVVPVSGRCMAMVFDPDFGSCQPKSYRSSDLWFNRTNRVISYKRELPETSWVALIDLDTRREIAHLPGRSACFSRSGDWLATLDEDGIVRVWHLPLRQPWQKIIRNAELATLITWALILPATWLVRRRIAKRKLSRQSKTDKPISD